MLLSSPIPQCVTLANGITLVVTPNPSADIVAGRFLLRAGSSLETPEEMGLSNLLGAVITKGTQSRSSLAIAQIVEDLGAGLGADNGTDFFLTSLKSVSADVLPLLELVADILRNPSFLDQEVELEKQMILQSIRSQREYPFSLAFDQLREQAYGAHPYGYAPLGTEATVPTLTPDALRNFHRRYFRPDNLVVSLAGHLTLEQGEAWVTQTLGDWSAPPEPLDLGIPPLTPGAPGVAYRPQESHQSVVMLSYLGAGVHDRAYMPLKVLATYLGNGMSSRLFTELREKQGLAYEVSALYPTRLGAGLFTTYLGTAPHNTDIALGGLQREIDRLQEVPLSAEELQACTGKILGQYALGKQTNAQIAQLFGWYELLDLGVAFDQTFSETIAALTPEDLQHTAQTYFQGGYVSLVGAQNFGAKAA